MTNGEEINLNYLRKEDEKYDCNWLKYYKTSIWRGISIYTNYIKRIWDFGLTFFISIIPLNNFFLIMLYC